ncbi:hypothetical protein SBDP1_1170014 [Syntrophobacter sp. SbD1]|nr:hypothetical protein SBDP1_1170014 [Syntrophobacter sp. SbD1]
MLLFTLPYRSGRLESIHHGHFAVHENNVILIGFRTIQHFMTIGSNIYAATESLHHSAPDFLVHAIVFY